MKNEEAIRRIKEFGLYHAIGDLPNSAKTVEAFNMAIEALKHAKDNHNSDTEECHLCMWENQYTPTTKNDLGVDCISRKAAEDITWQDPSYTDPLNILTEVRDKIRELPSVTPQEPQTFEWCDMCKEYDQDNHCCHRWSKVIRDTVEDMKQEYIEREVLDKIRAEIEQKIEQERFARSVFCGEEKDAVKAEQCTGSIFAYNNVIRFIDKYKTESEDKG